MGGSRKRRGSKRGGRSQRGEGWAPGHWGIPSKGPAAILEDFLEAALLSPWEGASHSPPPGVDPMSDPFAGVLARFSFCVFCPQEALSPFWVPQASLSF